MKIYNEYQIKSTLDYYFTPEMVKIIFSQLDTKTITLSDNTIVDCKDFNDAYNRKDCTVCKHKVSKATDEPCKTCEIYDHWVFIGIKKVG